MKTKYKFIEFEDAGDDVYLCRDTSDQNIVGKVWYTNRFECFIFSPELSGEYCAEELADIQHFMGQLKHD